MLVWVSILLQAVAIILLSSKVKQMDEVLKAIATNEAVKAIAEVERLAKDNGISVREALGGSPEEEERFYKAKEELKKEINRRLK